MSTPFALLPNDFNIGKDVSGRIFDDTGVSRNLQEIGHLISFSGELLTQIVKAKPISYGGLPLFETIWEGVELALRFTRARGNVEYIAITAQQNFYALDLRPNFAVAWSVLDRDGTVDTFLASGLKLVKPHLGTYAADKEVEQSLNFTGQIAQWTGPNAPPIGSSPLGF